MDRIRHFHIAQAFPEKRENRRKIPSKNFISLLYKELSFFHRDWRISTTRNLCDMTGDSQISPALSGSYPQPVHNSN